MSNDYAKLSPKWAFTSDLGPTRRFVWCCYCCWCAVDRIIPFDSASRLNFREFQRKFWIILIEPKMGIHLRPDQRGACLVLLWLLVLLWTVLLWILLFDSASILHFREFQRKNGIIWLSPKWAFTSELGACLVLLLLLALLWAVSLWFYCSVQPADWTSPRSRKLF